MDFNEKVWRLLERIPRGKVTTYKAIAAKLGSKAYRAVGNACGANPNAPQVPCHRVVLSSGRLGGYSSTRNKAAMLREEGVHIRNNKVDLKKYFYTFS